jgi:MFS family permease
MSRTRRRRSSRRSDGTYGGRSYTRRRRPSTASTLGTAVGALIAGALYALLGQLPWWAWAGLIVLGLVIGYLVHRRRVGA